MEGAALQNFKEAIRIEQLIDVSHLGGKIGLLCPTFVTSGFWDRVRRGAQHRNKVVPLIEVIKHELDQPPPGSIERLVELLDRCSFVLDMVKEGKFGTVRDGTIQDRPWVVGVTALVDHIDGRGTVVVVGQCGEDLDFGKGDWAISPFD